MKKAFTLAEVLITLGIIGVVAALTIPALISNHNKKVVAARLSKAYNTISNAIRLSENDNGMMSDWPTGANLNVDSFWNTYLKPYFSGARICENCRACGYPSNCTDPSTFGTKWAGIGQWALETNSSRLLFQFSDGTVIFFPRNTINEAGEAAYVSYLFIDINGAQKPNEAGRDVFCFVRDYEKGRISAPQGDCKASVLYCTYEIMSNGWQIPKDYPYRL